MERLFAKNVSNFEPGFVFGVFNENEVVSKGGFGSANLEWNVLNDASNTRFRIASTSKQFTAAAIALLVLKNKLSLNQTLGEFIPQLKPFENITVYNLIYHTGGMPDYLNYLPSPNDCSSPACLDAKSMLSLLADDKLLFQPGTKFAYDNTGYWLLSLIVEKVSGQSLRQFAKDEIFTPLKMHSTEFHDNLQHWIPQRAISYFSRNNTFLEHINQLEMVGDGGLITTVDDMLKWNQLFFNQNQQELLGKRLIDSMLTKGFLNNGSFVHYDRIPSAFYSYGLISVDKYNEQMPFKAIFHTGFYLGYTAQFLNFIEKKVTIVVFCNNENLSAPKIADQIAEIALRILH